MRQMRCARGVVKVDEVGGEEEYDERSRVWRCAV
jgi:hypothetical protein